MLTKYVFLTGGFDSSAILINYYLNRDYIIIPIYISDGWADNGDVGKWQRQCQRQELDSIRQICQCLIQDFPQYKRKLKELIIIEKIEYSQEIKAYADEMYQKGMSVRPVNQMASIAQVCHERNIYGDVGVIFRGDLYRKRLRKKLIGFGTDDCSPNLELCEPFFRLYQRLRFPIIHLTILDILGLAEKHEWLDYLKLSWSCWFPSSQGEPCGKCPMCKERVIPHRTYQN